MSERPHEPQQLLESLLSPEEASDEGDVANEVGDGEIDDVDTLIDELEVLLTQAKRVPFGRKLMVDEDHALDIVDRLRTALPAEVRQAHRILDEQERILDSAREQARQMLNDRGLLAELEIERERVISAAEREAERMRVEADEYVRKVLTDLSNRLNGIQASVQKGIDALAAPDDTEA